MKPIKSGAWFSSFNSGVFEQCKWCCDNEAIVSLQQQQHQLLSSWQAKQETSCPLLLQRQHSDCVITTSTWRGSLFLANFTDFDRSSRSAAHTGRERESSPLLSIVGWESHHCLVLVFVFPCVAFTQSQQQCFTLPATNHLKHFCTTFSFIWLLCAQNSLWQRSLCALSPCFLPVHLPL